jgi:predicted nucleotidyltransferase
MGNNGTISSLTKQEEVVADFIVDEAYPSDVIPLSCVLSGSRAYGLETPESDHDYIGIHLMNSWECLEHPFFRQDYQVINRRYTTDYKQISTISEEKTAISLDSFEMWKFVDLIRKGSFQAYEILYLPEIHHAEGINNIILLCRACLTNKISKAVVGMVMNTWGKDKSNRKKTVMAYYRLAQTIYLLKEGEFEWKADTLFDYIKTTTNLAGTLLLTYKDSTIRDTPIPEDALPTISHEIVHLMNEIDKAMIETSLPSEVPSDTLQNLLGVLKETRGRLI